MRRADTSNPSFYHANTPKNGFSGRFQAIRARIAKPKISKKMFILGITRAK
jgi:hypothetical protein